MALDSCGNGALTQGSEGTTASKPDVRVIMAEIRKNVAADLQNSRDKRPSFAPSSAEFSGGTARKAGELLHSEELRYLNTNYSYSSRISPDAVTSHRAGIIGKVIVKLKRKVVSILRDSLLKDYIAAERDFNANVVRFLNDVSKYVDARDASNFWELIRKVDVDVTKALDRIERISDEQMASLRTSEKRITGDMDALARTVNSGHTKLAEQAEAIKTIDGIARGLEGIVAQLGKYRSAEAPRAEGVDAAKPLPDFSYLLLENRYRGSEQLISDRLSIYPPVFSGATKPVLELGPGRGELQLLFKGKNLPSYGVDLDEAMVKTSVQRGVDARLGDGIAHLRALQDGSIGGLIAIQVVEHLTRHQLEELCCLARSKVAKGGRVVFETINPQSVMALSSNYFRDPTHVWPLHPDTLGYIMTLAGLKIVETRKLSPVGEGASLKEVPVGEYMSPRWVETVEGINRNIRQLNDLLYGYQDYCIIAEAV